MLFASFSLVIMVEETLVLGGNIELTGFRDVDRSSLVIVKKLVGNYARKFNETSSDFEKLSLHLKTLNESKTRFELHGKLVSEGNPVVAMESDFNLFFVIDRTLKKIEGQLHR